MDEIEQLQNIMDQLKIGKFARASELAALGDPEQAVAIQLAVEATIHMEHGALGRALELFLECMLRLQQVPNPATQSMFTGLAWIYHLHGANTVALRFIDSMLENNRRNNIALNTATNLTIRGTILFSIGRLKEGVRDIAEAVELSRGLGKQATYAVALNNLAYARIFLGDLELAEAELNEAIGLMEKLDAPGRLAQFYDSRGVLEQAKGNLDEAQACFEQAIELAEHANTTPGAMEYQYNLGKLLMKRSLPAQALAPLQQALTAALANDTQLFIPHAYQALSGCHEQLGHTAKAFENYQLYIIHNKKTQEMSENIFALDPIQVSTDFDASNAAESSNQLLYLATTDPTTGLYNRVHFRQMADLALQGGSKRNPCALVLVNIQISGDAAKQKNTLRAAANALGCCLFVGDIASHFHYGQLLVLMPNANTKAAQALAAKIEKRFSETAVDSNEPGEVISAEIVSATVLPKDAHLLDALNRMELGLEKAKRAGKSGTLNLK